MCVHEGAAFNARICTGTPEENLATVFDTIQAIYKRDNVNNRYRVLTMRMIGGSNTTYPKLKGKAAEIRDLTPVLLEIWQAGMDATNETHVTVKLALETGAKMDALIHDYPDYKFPGGLGVQFRELAFLHCQLTSCLCNTEGEPLFNVTVKLHYLMHCGLRAEWLNPRHSWCFQGEDYMGHIKVLIATCTRGNRFANVSSKIVSKLRIGLHFLLSGYSVREALQAHAGGSS